jgi:hypothetical protein
MATNSDQPERKAKWFSPHRLVVAATALALLTAPVLAGPAVATIATMKIS